MSIILASQSPRRRELLGMLGLTELTILPAVGEECAPAGLSPELTVQALARAKAVEVLEKTGPGDVVIAADTIVCIDGAILNKPRDRQEAFSMLRRLSGRTHTVHTGVCVLSRERERCETESTHVRFRELTDEEINAYIATNEFADKAGAYGIQGRGSVLISGIDGDYFNVVGLPLTRLHLMLADFGLSLL